MSSKKDKPEVFDYLLSIDYGICFGPVDSYNQCWVKEKPIWCGRYTERVDIEVHLPDLFGGDEGEGGCVGTVEAYIGTDDQIASVLLADRPERTIETMPGYPGLAHLFFRGNLGGEEPIRNVGTIQSLVNYVFGIGRQPPKRGFRWTTNNPYLPPMKVNLTRLPQQLEANYSIYPPIIVDGVMVDDPDGIDVPPPGLVDPPSPQNSTTMYSLVAPPAIDDLRRPYTVLDFSMFTEEEATLAAEQGWLPELKINYNVGFLNSVPTSVPARHHIRIYALDVDDVILATYDRERTEYLSANYVVEESIPLGTAVRKVLISTTFWTDGASVSSTDGGPREFTVTFRGEDTLSRVEVPFVEKANPTDTADGIQFKLPYAELAIDSGLVGYSGNTAIGAYESPIGGDGPESWVGNAYLMGYGALESGEIDFDTPIFPYADPIGETGADTGYDVSGEGFGVFRKSLTIFRPGTRWIVAYTNANRSTPVLTYWTQRYTQVVLKGPPKVEGTQHCEVDGTLGVLPDANPAQIIYECLTNAVWGKGESPAMIDTASFVDAAVTLRSEFFGLSMIWVEQSTIEEFVQEVLDHIQAFLYQDPQTALWTLKLLRDDYVIEEAMHIGESTANLTSQKRKAWGETINEIVVSYTDPITEKAATVSSHNLGNIAMNGGIISETRNYYGIRNAILAKVVADRDVESAGYPVFTCQAQVNRKYWKLRPGDVVTLSWGEEGLVLAVMRVLGIDYGSPSDRNITLDLSEDIYALEQTSYSGGQGSLLDTDDRVAADPMDVETVITAPHPAMVRAGLTTVEIDEAEPAVPGMIMADNNPRPFNVQVWTDVVKANGATVVEEITSVPVTRSALTEVILPREVQSILPFGIVDRLLFGDQEVGDILMLGVVEAETELVMLDSYDTVAGEWTVSRGIWDTVPVEWPVGSRIWAFPSGVLRADPKERAAGEVRTYRLLPRTNFETLAYADAADLTVTFTNRPFAPFRPADCQLDGNGPFVGVDYSFLTTGAALPATITASWVNRNRATEDAVINSWTDGSATPEVGQTTVLRFYDSAGNYSHEITGLTGTSYIIPIASFSPVTFGFIEFSSDRDGLRALWGDRLVFDIRQGSYGIGYGEDYGARVA